MISESYKRGHPLSACAKFSEKLTFLIPDMQTHMCISGGLKCVLQKIFRTYLIDGPK